MKIIQRSVAMISIFLLLFTSFPLDVFLATENMDNEVCEIIEDDANELNINQAGDYYVYSKDDLVEISNIVNSGNNLAGKTIYICQDIDMAGINWIPIGNQQYSFCGSIGTIDGTVKYIKNLTVNSQYGGLIGNMKVSENSVIRNINIWNANISATNAGGLIGYAGCSSQSNLTIENCNVSGKITGTGATGTGGLIGILQCSSNSNIKMEKCINESYVYSFGSGSIVGGLIGHVRGNANNGARLLINKSCNLGKVEGIATYSYCDTATGGLIGTLQNDITDILQCFNEGAVSGKAYYAYCGGAIGNLDRNTTTKFCLANSYVNANIKAQCTNGTSQAGGLIGHTTGDNFGYANIVNCYATGTLDARNGAGISCWHEGCNKETTILSCYYDKTRFGLGDNQFACALGFLTTTWYTGKVFDSKGLTNSQMKIWDNYKDWETEIWGINDANNNGYPYLKWYANEDDNLNELEKNEVAELNNFIRNMPKLTQEEARLFLAFVYNASEYESLDLTNDKTYQMLTGNIDTNTITLEELRAQMWAFSTLTRSSINQYVGEASERMEYLTNELILYLEKELDGLQDPAEEIVNDTLNNLLGFVEEGITGLFTNALGQATNIVLTGETFDKAEDVIGAYEDVSKFKGEVDTYVSRIVAGIQAAFLPLQGEIVGRYSYFQAYLVNRETFDSNDDSFKIAMDYAFLAAKENNASGEFIDMTTWITGKDSWANHRETMDKWAEYFYLFEQYINTDIHYYQKKIVEPSCYQKGYTECTCVYCGYTYHEDEVEMIDHTYYVDSWIIEEEATCSSVGKKVRYCSVCGSADREDISMIEHEYGDEWIIDKEADYFEDGEKSHHCIRCNARKDIMVIPKLEKINLTGITVVAYKNKCDGKSHEAVAVNGVPNGASIQYSIDDGKTWIDECPIVKECEEEVKVRVKVYLDDIHNEYISDVVMAKIDHCFMEIEKKDSSCTENGWEMYSECKYCGLKKDYVEIKATGHKFGETLLYDENTHWKECTCGEKENILEHVEDSGETILEPTEDGTGIKAYKCKECHYIMRTESIDKIIVNDSNIKEEEGPIEPREPIQPETPNEQGDSELPEKPDSSDDALNENIRDWKIEKITEDEIVVDISSELVVTLEELNELCQKNKTHKLIFKVNNNTSITFEKGTMSVVEGMEMYDFKITIVPDYTQAEVSKIIQPGNFISKVIYNYSGKLPAEASIRIPVGLQHVGKTLYYTLLKEDGTFGVAQTVAVDAEGYITVKQDHCSSYVITTENPNVVVSAPKTVNSTSVLITFISLFSIAYIGWKIKNKTMSNIKWFD